MENLQRSGFVLAQSPTFKSMKSFSPFSWPATSCCNVVLGLTRHLAPMAKVPRPPSPCAAARGGGGSARRRRQRTGTAGAEGKRRRPLRQRRHQRRHQLLQFHQHKLPCCQRRNTKNCKVKWKETAEVGRVAQWPINLWHALGVHCVHVCCSQATAGSGDRIGAVPRQGVRHQVGSMVHETCPTSL